FEIMAAHLIAQGRKSYGPDALHCLYRAPDGCACPVGCLIPAELYGAELEGQSVEHASVRAVLPIFDDPRAPMKVCAAFQDIHDQQTDWAHAIAALRASWEGGQL